MRNARRVLGISSIQPSIDSLCCTQGYVLYFSAANRMLLCKIIVVYPLPSTMVNSGNVSFAARPFDSSQLYATCCQ